MIFGAPENHFKKSRELIRTKQGSPFWNNKKAIELSVNLADPRSFQVILTEFRFLPESVLCRFNSFVRFFQKNKLPNAILLYGPKGLGKATFTYHYINYILFNITFLITKFKMDVSRLFFFFLFV